MITRKEYELKGNFKYYETDELTRRLDIYETYRKDLTENEQANIEFGGMDVGSYILKKYADEDGYLEVQIIEDLNIKKEVMEVMENLKELSGWLDKDVEEFKDIYNKYPHLIYLYVSADILTTAYQMIHEKRSNIYRG